MNAFLKIGEPIQFYEALDFNDVRTELIKINNSLHDSIDSTANEFFQASFFNFPLSLNGIYENDQYFVPLSHDGAIGSAEAKETSLINRLLNNSAELVENADYHESSLMLTFKDESTIKWGNLTRDDINKITPIVIGNQIICTLVVKEVVDGNQVHL